MNRKGFALDSFYWIAISFVVGVSLVLIYIMLVELNDSFQANPLLDNKSKQVMQDNTDSYPNIWDRVWFTVFIVGMFGILGLVFVLESNPAVLFIALFVIVVLSAFAGFLSNAWDDVGNASALLSNAQDNFPLTGFVLDNYLVFSLVMVFLIFIVFFANPTGGVGI